jgi:hypothetical protein
MTTAPAATNVEQRVLDHLSAKFGVKPDTVQVLSLAPRDLPAGAQEFYVEAKGTHGHDNYNYVVMGDKVYCSRLEGEFARLVREQNLLERKDVGAAQYMRLYSLFALPRQVKYIDANALSRNPQDYRGFPQVQAPTLSTRPDGGVTLTFFATPVDALQPSKWMVSISRNLEITVHSESAATR